MTSAATTTLADALLDDLEDLSDDPVHESEDDAEPKAPLDLPPRRSSQLQPPHDEDRTQRELASGPAKDSTLSFHFKSQQRLPRLLQDPTLIQHLQTVRDEEQHLRDSNTNNDTTISLPLILDSNRFLGRLAEEAIGAHSDLAGLYRSRFPELEEAVSDPGQYLRAVLTIDFGGVGAGAGVTSSSKAGDDDNETTTAPFPLAAVNTVAALDLARHSDALSEFLAPQQVLTLTVAASTTSGRPFTSQQQRERVRQAATYLEQVLKVQAELQAFVAARLAILAPNCCALVGPDVTAKVLALGGGSLHELSRIPSSNLQILGQNLRGANHGGQRSNLSAHAPKAHEGVLAGCDLVQSLPRIYQHKALKMVAAKFALAVRCDMTLQGATDPVSSGLAFRRQLEEKFQKLLEPARAPTLKALPKPDLTIKKKRGGKRVRRMKEKYEETALMKQANTRAFSAATGEYGDDAMGFTRGLLDTSEGVSGVALRKNLDKKQVRVANTKASRKRAAQMSVQNPAASTSSYSGLATSIVFTPSQGMELVNPTTRSDRVEAANHKWFGDQAGFRSALPPPKK